MSRAVEAPQRAAEAAAISARLPGIGLVAPRHVSTLALRYR